jgi:subtilisin family serine protease
MALPFDGYTGRGVRVAVIDSGVNAAHPHIGHVSGGVTIGEQPEEGVYVDLLGHGTAVMAAIQEKAPDAEYFAVRVFCNSLRTSIDSLVKGIEWCIEKQVHVINLSLGTANPTHRDRFLPLIARAAETGATLVSARDANGNLALPGSLPGVIGVSLDWDCPRESYYLKGGEWYASGYPRALPGVPPRRNLHGISFAVANMTGFIARAAEGIEDRSYENVTAALKAQESCFP